MNLVGYFYPRYLALGFSVIPIRTLAYASMERDGTDLRGGAKAPLVKWTPFQKRFATRDEIKRWTTHWPSAGIAVVCGLLSDVMVFDDDLLSRIPLVGRTPQQEDGYQVLLQTYGSHAELERLYKVGDDLQAALLQIPTARARSSKGRHFYFRMPRNDDGVQIAAGNKIGFVPGWDLRGEGGYVILPPTLHPDGPMYTWEINPEDGIADAPKWLREYTDQQKAPFESKPALKGNVWQINAPIPQGRRNSETTKWLGAQMASGGQFHDELKWPILWELLVGHNTCNNVPPLDLGELKVIFDSICGRETKQRKTNPQAFPDDWIEQVELRTAAELGVMSLHAPDYAIKDFIVDGTTQLFGQPKSGKSWFSFQSAGAVALSRPLFPTTASMYAFANHPQGFSAHQGDVLYLALEDSWLRLQNRGKEIFGSADDRMWPANFHFAINWEPCFEGGLLHIETWLKAHPHARLVVIDTIAAFMGAGLQDKGSAFRAEYRMFRPIFELGQRYKVPILVVDHASKGKGKAGSGDPYDTGAGTLGSQACVDSVMVLQHDQKGPYARLFHKGRDIERGFLDLEHTTKSPLWKIRTTFDELKAARAAKKGVVGT